MLPKSLYSKGGRESIAPNVIRNSPFFGKENNYFELNLVSGEKAKGQLKIKVLMIDFQNIKKTLVRT
jgi:hypothetical protein